MSNMTRIVPVIMVLGLLAGCGTTRYIISTTDGTLIQAKGQPHLNTKTGMYEYKDLDGHAGTIKKEDVKQVLER